MIAVTLVFPDEEQDDALFFNDPDVGDYIERPGTGLWVVTSVTHPSTDGYWYGKPRIDIVPAAARR